MNTDQYRKAETPLPAEYLVWELYGAGMDNFGRAGQPVSLPLPRPGPEELLARVDALGLCYSDVKIIQQGENHPRLTGRNLAAQPVVVGHEVALTIAAVGEGLRERYQVGRRFIVQPDVYANGERYSFGYALRGGAAQYTVIGPEIHSAESGSYLIPIAKESTGYSEAALTEPWACVERSYHIRSRPGPRSRGLMWIIGLSGADLGNYYLGEGFDEHGTPRRVMLTEVVGPIISAIRRYSAQYGFSYEETAALARLLPLLLERRSHFFDDIILLGLPRAGLVERLSSLLVKGGHLAFICPETVEHREDFDLGQIHYDSPQYIGAASWVLMDAYQGRRSSALAEAGAAWFIGAGGPVGQMHLQRALEREHAPRVILVTEQNEARLQMLQEHFGKQAEARGSRFYALRPEAVTRRFVYEITDREGFSHIVLLAPVAKLAEVAWQCLADRGLLNVFAGFARGSKARLRISPIFTRGCRIVGSSGSGIEDLRYVLAETEVGHLATDRVVAAVGGISALRDGITATAEGKFPGRVVIYPQLDFPLTAIGELRGCAPAVAEKLEEGRGWNRGAEAALLAHFLAK